MALKVVSMEEFKLEVLFEPERTGATVAEVCGRRGISRASYYRYRRRYLEEGLDGLEPRSRRPRGSPGQIEAELEVEIVSCASGTRAGARAGSTPSSPGQGSSRRRWRRSTGRCGATTWSPRSRRGGRKARSASSARSLTTCGRSTARRSRWPAGAPAWVVDCLDDHARFLLAAIAVAARRGEAAWACFLAASCRLRPPAAAALRQPLELHRPPVRPRRSLSSAGWPRSGSS